MKTAKILNQSYSMKKGVVANNPLELTIHDVLDIAGDAENQSLAVRALRDYSKSMISTFSAGLLVQDYVGQFAESLNS